ncbi:MAG: dockerin type I domain-containing protein [Eubacteriales bacterium]|nr:dockerin type I domain-containing protein [Eubacteriales bacterium]
MKKRICLILTIIMVLASLVLPSLSTADVTLLGDVDLVNGVTSNDAACILRHLVHLETLSAQSLENADVNQDGEVTANDAAIILRYIVHLESQLPPSGGPVVTAPPTPTGTPTPTPTMAPNPSIGDVNLDGDVTAADAALILRYIVKLETLSDLQKVNADVTYDSQITAADAARILRYVVKLVGDLGVWPDPTPRPTPTATPTPTPIPTNAAGLPAVGDSGLIVADDDPNYDRIMNYYLYKRLWTNETNPNNTSWSASEFWSTSTGNQYSFSYKSVNMQGDNNNKDIIGWVHMEFYGKENNRNSPYSSNIGTSQYRIIDEPIMYNPMNYYFDHSCYGLATDGGSLMSLYNSLSKNIAITGHNSRPSKTHFHHLHTMQNGVKAMGSTLNPSDYIFDISIFGRSKWQVWAMYETTATEASSTLTYNISSSCGGNVQQWINYQLTRSEVSFKVSPSVNDQFMTFYTCADAYDSGNDTTPARLYVFLVYVG